MVDGDANDRYLSLARTFTRALQLPDLSEHNQRRVGDHMFTSVL